MCACDKYLLLDRFWCRKENANRKSYDHYVYDTYI